MERFAIRVRFHSDGSAIAHPEKTLEVALPDGKAALFKALNAETLDKADRFSVQVRGFDDKQVATAFGRRMKNAIRICGIQLRTGLDAGDDILKSGVYEAGKKLVRQMFGIEDDVPIHNDVHGLTVYEDSDPEPRFVGVSGKARVGRNKDSFVAAIRRGFALGENLSDRQVLAAEMYNLSHFEGSLRARFVTLVTSVECVAQPEDLPPEIHTLVDDLLRLAKQHDALSGLATNDPTVRDSLLGRLEALKRESIGKACERVVGRLLDAPSRVQFKQWYDVRSKMVHTGKTPAAVDLGTEVTRLDEMVSKLLLADIDATRTSVAPEPGQP